jgi:hypothetical protein
MKSTGLSEVAKVFCVCPVFELEAAEPAAPLVGAGAALGCPFEGCELDGCVVDGEEAEEPLPRPQQGPGPVVKGLFNPAPPPKSVRASSDSRITLAADPTARAIARSPRLDNPARRVLFRPLIEP